MSNETIRDAIVGTIAAQPFPVKRWLMNHPRLLLGVLFRVERGDMVISPAGPSGNRFRMRLKWQDHTPYIIGTYEPEFLKALRQHVRPGDTCVDVGGNLGYYCLLMSNLVGPKGRVITFEPVEENLAVLRENIAVNKIENVELANTALGAHPGVLSLIRSEVGSVSATPSVRGYAVEGAQSSIEVPVNTLDAYLEEKGWRPAVIKIDVEGAELEVLRGAVNTLRVARPTVLVEVHGWEETSSAEVREFFSDVGYRISLAGTRGHEAFCVALPNERANSGGSERVPSVSK
jgi:FkbM family methyltransferase